MKEIKRIDIRDVCIDEILYIVNTSGVVHFLKKVKNKTWQDEVVQIYNAGKTVITKHSFKEARFIGSRRLLNPVLKKGFMLVAIDISALNKIYSNIKKIRSKNSLEAATELSGSISSLGPIQKIGLLSSG